MTGKSGQQLRFMNGQQHLDSLEFHNHSLFYDKVQVRSGIQAEVIVHHRVTLAVPPSALAY